MKCYNITLLIFITMIGRIMLHKKTLLFAALSAALWGGATQAADAAVVASLKPVGFIASAIADGVTETEVLLPDGASEHDYSLRPSDVKRLQNVMITTTRKKVTKITITAISTCIFGFPQR